MEHIVNALRLIGRVISYLVIYKKFYSILGFFTTRVFPPAAPNHKYAVLVAARNEEKVIGQLIDSIRSQEYPRDLVDIYVVADNCTDATAETARRAGAVVYERFDPDHRTKGYALQFLVNCLRRDKGIQAYEGYFFFDADNLLKSDFIARMNDAFDAGEKLITSFRNTKNFSDNWIAASYAIHWYRTIRNEHRARSVLRMATRIQGTGFLVANELLKDGWNYVSLTEDRELSAVATLAGYRITYNDAAEFYDEQPTDAKIMMRQRIRWGKGHLWAFVHYGPRLFAGIFSKNCLRCYDMFWTVIPRNLTSYVRRIAILVLSTIVLFRAGETGTALAAPLMRYWKAVLSGVGGAMFTAAYVLFMERDRVPRASLPKKLWFCFTFPIFDKVGLLSTIIALFRRVEWKPIPHTVEKSIAEMEQDLSDDPHQKSA